MGYLSSLVTLEQPLATTAAPSQEFWLLRWFVRLRWMFFALVAAALLAGHNGQWRIGRDSALYREVARNLSHGNGFTFRGDRERHAYPGMPVLLAGIDKVFGSQDGLRPRAALCVMLLIAFLTLIVIYRLIAEHFPRWAAVCVTTGVGISFSFNQQAHELMTDLPFLFGSCLVLLGASLLERPIKPWLRAGFCLGVGALLAISMRPTFWALAAAGVGAMLIGPLMPRRCGTRHFLLTRRAVWIIAPLLLLALLLVLTSEYGIFGGKYAEIAHQHLSNLGRVNWPDRLQKLFAVHFPEAVFGFEMPLWAGAILTLITLASATARTARRPLWGMYVLATFAMMLIMGSVPRYFLMILPLLLLEWAMLIHLAARWIGRLIPWRFTPDWVMLIGLGFATVINAGQTVNLILEQHGREIIVGKSKHPHHAILSALLAGNWQVEQRPFLEIYRGGKMLPVVRVADELRKIVPSHQRILAPEPRILTFLSGRPVFDTVELLARKPGNAWEAVLKARHLHYCVWGPHFPEETRIVRALRRRMIEAEHGTLVVVEPMSSKPAAAGHTGIFIARIHSRTPPGKKPNPPIYAPRHLPGANLKVYDRLPPRGEARQR